MKTIILSPTPPKWYTVRNIAAFIVCMLLFATTGCEQKDEFDEFESETITARFFVRGVHPSFPSVSVLVTDWRDASLVLIDGRPVGSRALSPINLPEEFQIQDLHVQVTFRRNIYDNHIIKIMDIIAINEEDVFQEGTRTVFAWVREPYWVCGDDDGRWGIGPPVGAMPSHHSFILPINFPEEFQTHRLFVSVTYHRHIAGRQECGFNIIKIAEIEERIFSSIFTVRRTDDGEYLLIEDFGTLDIDLIAKPINLPEEYRQDGLIVSATFRQFWSEELYEGRPVTPIEITAIMEAPKVHAETRIVGGGDAPVIPWQALISYGNDLTSSPLFGGVIITRNLILTARHSAFQHLSTPENTRVRVGITYAYTPQDNTNTFRVSDIILSDNQYLDVALLVLSEPIPVNHPAARPINFNTPDDAFYAVGREVSVSGWGAIRPTIGAPLHRHLQRVSLNIISDDDARAILRRDLPLLSTERAAIGTSRSSPYYAQMALGGDSGGPVTTVAGGQPVLIGIIQGGNTYCTADSKGCPTVFVRMNHVLNWFTYLRDQGIIDVPIPAPPIAPPPPPRPAPFIPGPARVGSANTVFTILNFPPGAIVTWSQSSNLQRVSNSDNTATFRVVPTCAAPGDDWIEARVSGVRDTIRHNVQVDAPPLPPQLPRATLSGSALICSNTTGTFTVLNNIPPNATITWTHSPTLRHISSSGATATFQAVGHSGVQASWVQAIVNCRPSYIRETWAGTPFVSGVRVISTTHTGNSTIRRFTAEFPEIQRTMINPTGWRWILDAPPCCARFVGNTNRETVDIEFNGGGFFDLIVSVTNACGEGTPHWAMIYYFSRSGGMRESTTARAQSRPISGTFHILLSYEADARMQNRYDVRIYDSSGNRVRQVIAKGDRVKFDLNDLSCGTYYLHICDGVGEPVIQPIVVENRKLN